jgi:hypothetical protein
MLGTKPLLLLGLQLLEAPEGNLSTSVFFLGCWRIGVALPRANQVLLNKVMTLPSVSQQVLEGQGRQGYSYLDRDTQLFLILRKNQSPHSKPKQSDKLL